MSEPTSPQSTAAMSSGGSAAGSGSHVPETSTSERGPEAPRQPWRETALGDDRHGVGRNVSWGAVIAGVVTFLAVSLLLSLIIAALGLGMVGSSGAGVASGIAAVVTLALATAAGGYVAGLLSGRAGLIHGFLAWATALLVAVVLSGLLVGSALGAVGNLMGPAASVIAENPDQIGSAAQDAAAQSDASSGDAAAQAEGAASSAAGGAMWTFAALLIGAIVSSVMGMLGSRSVVHDRSQDEPQRSA